MSHYYKRILISAHQAHNGLRVLEKYFRWLLAEGDWLSETSSSHLRKHPYWQNSGYYFDPEVLNFCLQDISDSNDDNLFCDLLGVSGTFPPNRWWCNFHGIANARDELWLIYDNCRIYGSTHLAVYYGLWPYSRKIANWFIRKILYS